MPPGFVAAGDGGGQIGPVPKTLILLLADDPALLARARRVADGVRRVRFAEVDVRPSAAALVDPASGAAALLTAADYDAVIVGVGGAGGGAGADAAAALAAFDPGRTLADKVGAAFAAGDGTGDGACWAALRALAAHGLLLVPPAGDGASLGDVGDARLGRRVATVAGWVRHARGHEHGHGHGHSHAH